MGKIPTRPLKRLQERHKEMARRLVMGKRQCDVARAMGVSVPRMSDIARSPVFMAYMRELSMQRDLDVKEAVKQGAGNGLMYLLRILDDGSPESRAADVRTKVRVAQDFLDREGTAPKVRSKKSANHQVGLHLTREDIDRLKLKRRFIGSNINRT